MRTAPDTRSSRPRGMHRPLLIISSVALAVSVVLGGCSTDTLRRDSETTTSTGSPTTTVAPTTTIDPATLPQTDEKPTATGDGFGRRMMALATAIITDDHTAGMPSFFPVEAYKQVKKNTDPAGDWKNRLIAAFAVDTHDAHVALGADAASATYLGVDVPEAAVWVKPGQEYNLLGYWRVYGTKMRFDVRGVIRTIPVTSLISWRGQWYVVHLGAIR